MNIYLACGLTHVPRLLFPDYVAFLHRLAGVLSANDDVTVKYALMNSDPQLAEKPFGDRARLCYLWDRGLVEEADLVVAEASFPSTGLGIELQIAEERKTPVILCFRNADDLKVRPIDYENPDHSRHFLQIGEGHVSLMALGLPSIKNVVSYVDGDEGIAKIFDAVSAYNPKVR